MSVYLDRSTGPGLNIENPPIFRPGPVDLSNSDQCVQVHRSRSCYWKGPLVNDGYWTGSTGPLVLDGGPLDHGTLEYTLQFSLDRPPSPVQWTISILC